jgi:hypothetical protein
MVKGSNKLLLTEETLKLAIEEYINSRLQEGINIKVTSVWQADADEDADLRFGVWFKEAK